MGGTCWDCAVPYDVDIATALEVARQRTFVEHDYWWPYDGTWDFPERPRPTSIAELWEDPTIQVDGTHSVLDIWGVRGPGEEPSIAEAAPLAPSVRQRLFGTEEPTRADYERAGSVVWDVVKDRGYANFVVLSREGDPHEIVFFGVTGD